MEVTDSVHHNHGVSRTQAGYLLVGQYLRVEPDVRAHNTGLAQDLGHHDDRALEKPRLVPGALATNHNLISHLLDSE